MSTYIISLVTCREESFYIPPNMEEQLVSFYTEVDPIMISWVDCCTELLYIGRSYCSKIQGKREITIFEVKEDVSLAVIFYHKV